MHTLKIPTDIDIEWEGGFGREAPFAGCESLKTIEVFSEGPDKYNMKNGALFYGNELRYVPAAIGEYTLPVIDTIPPYSFQGSKLLKILIPDGVKHIGDYVFDGCSALTEVIIPDTVETIGVGAFRNCVELPSITVPKATLGNNAFEGCVKMASFTFPSGTTIIKDELFKNCSTLATVNNTSDIKEIGSSAFEGCSALENISFGDLEIIGVSAFTDCVSLREFTIPDTVSFGLGPAAFAGCTSLSSVTLSKNLSSIPLLLFYGCENLTSVQIPSDVTSIRFRAFDGCTRLNEIVLPDSTKGIGYRAFYGCTSLTRAVMPGVETSGMGATEGNGKSFEGCIGLKELVLSKNPLVIYNRTFADCSSLTEINIPGSSMVYADALFGCQFLREVTFNDNVVVVDTEITASLLNGLSNLSSVYIKGAPEDFDFLMGIQSGPGMDIYFDTTNDDVDFARCVFTRETLIHISEGMTNTTSDFPLVDHNGNPMTGSERAGNVYRAAVDQWILATFKMTYMVPSGTDLVERVTYFHEAERPQDPARDGCVFLGWYTDDTYSAEYDFSEPVEANTILYGRFSVDLPQPNENLAYNGTSFRGIMPYDGVYSLTGSEGTNAGPYKATATLESGFVWTGGETAPAEIDWSIAKADLANLILNVSGTYVYDGNEQTVSYSLDSGAIPAPGDSDYVVSGDRFTLPGTYALKLAAVPESVNWTGATETEWVLESKKIDKPKAVKKPFIGKEQTVFPEGPEYDISGYYKATSVGDYTFTVTLKEGYAWSDGSTDPITVTWSIEEQFNWAFFWFILVDITLASIIVLSRRY